MNKNYQINFNLDFKRNKNKGLYIALEGIDGAGKTVQSKKLLDYFAEKGKNVLTVTEPRRTGLIGRVINEFLQKRIKIPAASFQYLITADRIAEQNEVIVPALEKGQIILSHRCFWSAIPYGILDITKGKSDFNVGNTLLVAQGILSMYFQIVIPDITFYLDVPAKVALERLASMGTKFEYYERLDRLTNVKKGYDWMINKFKDEFTVIKGDKDPEIIMQELMSKIENFKK
jgi:dTMP kinase